MQDGQLDAFGRVNDVPERETEQPRQVLGRLVGRHERGSAEGELLAAQADPAAAGRHDVLIPVGPAPEVQADYRRARSTERAHRGVVRDAGLAPDVLQVGECGRPARPPGPVSTPANSPSGR